MKYKHPTVLIVLFLTCVSIAIAYNIVSDTQRAQLIDIKDSTSYTNTNEHSSISTHTVTSHPISDAMSVLPNSVLTRMKNNTSENSNTTIRIRKTASNPPIDVQENIEGNEVLPTQEDDLLLHESAPDSKTLYIAFQPTVVAMIGAAIGSFTSITSTSK